MVNSLIEEITMMEAKQDVIEDEIDIENLLQANLGDMTIKDILNMTEATFPSDLVDLDFRHLDLQPNQCQSSPSTSPSQVEIEDHKKDKMLDQMNSLPQIVKQINQNLLLKSMNQEVNQLSPNGPSFSKSSSQASAESISCPICGKSFPRGSQWMVMKHISSSHDTAIIYPCQYCDEQLPCQSILTAHFRRHQLTHPLQCAQCGYKPGDMASFVRHVKSVHVVTRVETARKMLILCQNQT